MHKVWTFKTFIKWPKKKSKIFIVPEGVLYLWAQTLMAEQMAAPAGLQMFVSLGAKPKSCCVCKDELLRVYSKTPHNSHSKYK